MFSSIKSIYGKTCSVVATAMWAMYFGQTVFSMLFVFLPDHVDTVLHAVSLCSLFIAVVWLMWPKLAHLSLKSVVNSNKATIGIFLLTLALIACPGAFIAPLVYSVLTDNSDSAQYAWFGIIGIPFFIVLSLIGTVLIFSSRPRSAVSAPAKTSQRRF